MSARFIGGDTTTLLTALAFQVAWSLVMVAVLARLGLLAFAVAWVVDRVLEMTPLTTDVWAWHGVPTLAGLAILVGLAAAATKVALAGKSLLGAETRGE